jgi:tetratricopeptide (TPR) repeat protein
MVQAMEGKDREGFNESIEAMIASMDEQVTQIKDYWSPEFNKLTMGITAASDRIYSLVTAIKSVSGVNLEKLKFDFGGEEKKSPEDKIKDYLKAIESSIKRATGYQYKLMLEMDLDTGAAQNRIDALTAESLHLYSIGNLEAGNALIDQALKLVEKMEGKDPLKTMADIQKRTQDRLQKSKGPKAIGDLMREATGIEQKAVELFKLGNFEEANKLFKEFEKIYDEVISRQKKFRDGFKGMVQFKSPTGGPLTQLLEQRDRLVEATKTGFVSRGDQLKKTRISAEVEGQKVLASLIRQENEAIPRNTQLTDENAKAKEALREQIAANRKEYMKTITTLHALEAKMQTALSSEQAMAYDNMNPLNLLPGNAAVNDRLRSMRATTRVLAKGYRKLVLMQESEATHIEGVPRQQAITEQTEHLHWLYDKLAESMKKFKALPKFKDQQENFRFGGFNDWDLEQKNLEEQAASLKRNIDAVASAQAQLKQFADTAPDELDTNLWKERNRLMGEYDSILRRAREAATQFDGSFQSMPNFDRFLQKVDESTQKLEQMQQKMQFTPQIRDQSSLNRSGATGAAEQVVNLDMNVNINGSDANPKEIANEVLTLAKREIRRGTLQWG